MDLISVIIPVYNGKEYLEACLSSVLHQTYANIEVIIVDDGSEDLSANICDKYAVIDKRVKVIHKKNEGVSIARNVGIENSHGEYIVFVDSDDIVHRRYIELLHNALRNSEADIAICLVKDFSDDCEIDEVVGEPLEKNCIVNWNTHLKRFYEDKARGIISWAWNKMYKRRVIIDIPFEKGPFWEDVVFNTRILCKHPTYIYVNTQLYYYRHRDGALTSCLRTNVLSAVNTEDVMWRLWKEFFLEEDKKYKYASYSLNKLCMDYGLSKMKRFDKEAQVIWEIVAERYRECFSSIPFCKRKVTIWLAVKIPWLYVALKILKHNESY